MSAASPARVPQRLLLALGLLLSFACRNEAKTVESFPEEFVGVGVELQMVGELPMVTRTVPNSPASEVGLKADDILVTVDGTATQGMTLGDVVRRLRGRPETQVVVEVKRGGEAKPITVVMRRRSMSRGDRTQDGKSYQVRKDSNNVVSEK